MGIMDTDTDDITFYDIVVMGSAKGALLHLDMVRTFCKCQPHDIENQNKKKRELSRRFCKLKNERENEK